MKEIEIILHMQYVLHQRTNQHKKSFQFMNHQIQDLK